MDMLHTLPLPLITEILKFLPLSKCVEIGIVNKEFSELVEAPYLIKQYSHVVIDKKPIFCGV